MVSGLLVGAVVILGAFVSRRIAVEHHATVDFWNGQASMFMRNAWDPIECLDSYDKALARLDRGRKLAWITGETRGELGDSRTALGRALLRWGHHEEAAKYLMAAEGGDVGQPTHWLLHCAVLLGRGDLLNARDTSADKLEWLRAYAEAALSGEWRKASKLMLEGLRRPGSGPLAIDDAMDDLLFFTRAVRNRLDDGEFREIARELREVLFGEAGVREFVQFVRGDEESAIWFPPTGMVAFTGFYDLACRRLAQAGEGDGWEHACADFCLFYQTACSLEQSAKLAQHLFGEAAAKRGCGSESGGSDAAVGD